MIFITGSDAPLYHYPITTGVLIAVNTLIHLGVTIIDPEMMLILPWCLEYGNGIHPLQWLSCNFLHADWMHLIGNMLFLWPFGLLVEGKLGWWRMLLLCLAICVLHASVQQTLMLGANYGADAQELAQQFEGNPEWEAMGQEEKDAVIESLRQGLLKNGYGRSLGASCLVFGLLAICAIWAPVNEFDVISRWGSYEWPVLTVAAMFIAKEIIGSFLAGGAISTPVLHMFGAAAGFVIGMGMLVLGKVDCEGFDLISRVTGERFQPWAMEEINPIAKQKRERDEARIKAEQEAAAREAAMPKWKVTAPVASGFQAFAPVEFSSGPASAPASSKAQPSAGSRPYESGTTHPSSKPIFPAPSPLVCDMGSGVPAVAGDSTPATQVAAGWMDGLDLPEPPKADELFISSIEVGDFAGAVRQLAALIKEDRAFSPPPTVLNKLAEGLAKAGSVDQAIKVFAFAASRHAAYANRWRIRSAMLVWASKRDVKATTSMLQLIDRGKLSDAEKQQIDQLLRAVKSASPQDRVAD